MLFFFEFLCVWFFPYSIALIPKFRNLITILLVLKRQLYFSILIWSFLQDTMPLSVFILCGATLHSISAGRCIPSLGQRWDTLFPNPKIFHYNSELLKAILSTHSAMTHSSWINCLVRSYTPKVRTACAAVWNSSRDFFALDSFQSCQPFII